MRHIRGEPNDQLQQAAGHQTISHNKPLITKRSATYQKQPKQFAGHQTTSSLPGIRIITQPTGSGFTTTKLPHQNLNNPTWIVIRHGPTNTGRININKSTDSHSVSNTLKATFIASRAARPSSGIVHEPMPYSLTAAVKVLPGLEVIW